MIKVGRYTAALLLLIVGGLLLLEQFTTISTVPILLNWWPVFLILLGFEFIYFSSKYKKTDRPLRLDLLGIMLSVLIAVVIVGSVHASTAIEYIKGLNINSPIVFLDEQKDSESAPVARLQSGEAVKITSSTNVNEHTFELEKTIVPVDNDTQQITLNNVSGGVNIRSGDVQDMEIATQVVVRHPNADEAKKIADQSYIHFTTGDDTQIRAEGQTYSTLGINKDQAVMNLDITVPKSTSVNYQIEVINGQLRIEDVPILEHMRSYVTNGSIELVNLKAEVFAETTNGEIKLEQIQGQAVAKTTTGVLKVSKISGDLTAESTVGAINITDVGGSVQAHTTTGKIGISSAQINSDWDINNSIGSVHLSLPEEADFEVEGQVTGSFRSDFNNIHKKDGIEGKNGTGAHLITIKTIGQVTLSKIK
ncbi:DUF4097 domain-containing protein [Paenibacillus sp. N1-5-1-14]|uniref:DUF4097 family beta strand repeat-containing protein n=1 Tax=Paenibacillus radicibacter TaxID=2972488 RepID=UPI002158E288|nr:DUF4097 domain-containing protein [Paenibacillus radicibacter]MCR8644747.1 DUF4097 domain-containing protein [Paenibacillus radicibacter]